MLLISVVIPSRHRDASLAQCLDRIDVARRRIPAECCEFIVTDDGSTSTAETMLRERFPWVKWVAGPRKGIGANRNSGARHATGKWLVFVDDDCLPEPGWLEAMAPRMRDENLDVIEGRTLIPDYRDSPFLYAPSNPTGGYFWTCNLAIRRLVFSCMGGFDEDFPGACEDMEFAWRIGRAGLRTTFCADALVLHPQRRLGLRGIIRNTLDRRWQVLYALKTGGTADRSASPISSAVRAAARESADLMRRTVQLLTRHDPAAWRFRWFMRAWEWITFPAVLPYLLCWHFRFQKMIATRARPDA